MRTLGASWWPDADRDNGDEHRPKVCEAPEGNLTDLCDHLPEETPILLHTV